MIKADWYYKNNLNRIVYGDGTWDENPRPKWADGTPARSKFITGIFEEYDLSKGEYPITTLRNTAIKTGIREIFWIYQKQSNSLKLAREMGINWWDAWNIGDDTIGQRYGATIKKYDLVNKLLKSLKEDPFSRRHIIDMYQYQDLDETEGLHPCAYLTTWSVRKVDEEYYLDMTLNQRSNDYIVANYINKAQYVVLQIMISSHLGYKIGKFFHLVQNLHIYDRHMNSALEILDRIPLNIEPTIQVTSERNFYDYSIDDFAISNVDGIKKLSNSLELAI
jgi:thymidylate synthase